MNYDNNNDGSSWTKKAPKVLGVLGLIITVLGFIFISILEITT